MRFLYFLVWQLKRFLHLRLSPEDRRHFLVGKPGVWRKKRDFQERFVKAAGLKPSDYFLDIGCGTLRGGIPIIEYLEKGHYYGIDIREHVFKGARLELLEAGLEYKTPFLIHFEDFKDLRIDQRFDFIWAFSVLIHLEDNIFEKCLEFVSRSLAQSGVFYANVSLAEGVGGKDGYWQGFPVVTRTLDFYRQHAHKVGLEMEKLTVLKNLGHNVGDPADDHYMLKFFKS